jgi:CDGSH-type Zn-finger protein
MESSHDAKKPSIEVAENGPYLVNGMQTLKNSRGETIPTKPVMALCRCGGSAKKPFCDGTHARIGFSGRRLAERSTNERVDYRGKRITIHDNRAVCAHAGYCTDSLSAAFNSGAEPWIDPDGADVEKLIETIRECPSGALSYSIDGIEHRDQDREPMISVSKDGPYVVVGGPELQDEEHSRPESAEHYTLCRCGGSRNKPFCDGTHWHIKFHDDKN